MIQVLRVRLGGFMGKGEEDGGGRKKKKVSGLKGWTGLERNGKNKTFKWKGKNGLTVLGKGT